ncbi:papain-like cysteine protease family protein [Kitasatospora sp. NPDC089509]|uniref:papain-like cysteine protease family protein n=1 Tax=Kitasatospora sp. NPDC089509 TaxID=3364079 RepID=UPI0037F36748
MNGPARGSFLRAGLAVLCTLAAVVTSGAGAAAADPTGHASRTTATSQTAKTTAAAPYDAGASKLNIDMEAQEQDQWCWAASGNTIATFLGHGTSQNSFCDLAYGQSTDYQCPNQPGQLSWVQTALSSLGVSPGQETGALPFDTIVSEVNAGRPIETGISWVAGGGHAQVIYGYDQSSQSIYWGDPWPSSNRYNLGSYSYYAGDNGQFNWNDSLYQIGA